MTRLLVALALLGLVAAHPCFDGTHGCDKDEGGVCIPDPRSQKGFKCTCRQGYTCVENCDDLSVASTCQLATAAPSAPPTTSPTGLADRPINCGGSWGEFGQCSHKCGHQGTWSQTYKIHRPERNGGFPCRFADGEVRTKSCNRHQCGCGKVYCQWKKNSLNYRREIHQTSIQVYHHDLESWGKKHHCALSSKSSSVRKDAHIVAKGEENCRCVCHNQDVSKDGSVDHAHKEWVDNKNGKYEITAEEKTRLPDGVVHSMHFFPGVKPIYEPPAKNWKECQEACRNLKSCRSWSMYTEEAKVYGSTCRVYDVPVDDPEKCDFTIPNFWTNGNFPCTAAQEEYGFRGLSGNHVGKSSYGRIDSHLAETSKKTCEQLGWDYTNWGTEYRNTKAVCGARPDCSMKFKSYKQADNFCKAKGARLCTLAETQANEAAGTGCKFDHIAVWTSTPCKNTGNHYYVTLGNERYRREAANEVTSTVHCADEKAQTVTKDKKNADGTFDIRGFLELGVQCCADEPACPEGQCIANGATTRSQPGVGTGGHVTGHVTQLSGASGVFLDREDYNQASFKSIEGKV